MADSAARSANLHFLSLSQDGGDVAALGFAVGLQRVVLGLLLYRVREASGVKTLEGCKIVIGDVRDDLRPGPARTFEGRESWR